MSDGPILDVILLTQDPVDWLISARREVKCTLQWTMEISKGQFDSLSKVLR